MSQSLANVLLHITFSTKNRRPLIDVAVEQELFPYIAGICRDIGCPAHKIGAADDHVHIACSLSRTVTISDLLAQLKGSSSKWIKTKGPRYRRFAWQAGYGAFSIGQSLLATLKRYILRQRQHHKRETFQDEFRRLLEKYKVEYDARYVWD